MTDKPFVTKGSEEYFAERERRITGQIAEAKSKIEEIEARVRGEITEIQAKRDTLRHHLQGFIDARNAMAERRSAAEQLVAELQAVIGICNTEMPVVDSMLDELEGEYTTEDDRLSAAEKSRHRQLSKHVRKKTRFEGRAARLQLRKNLFFGDKQEVRDAFNDAAEREHG